MSRRSPPGGERTLRCNVGAGDRINYTVYGDAVNLASHLEQINKEHGTLILDIRKVYPETKVIAISGGSEVVTGDYLHVAKALGAIKVFQKPLDLEALVAVVEESVRVE